MFLIKFLFLATFILHLNLIKCEKVNWIIYENKNEVILRNKLIDSLEGISILKDSSAKLDLSKNKIYNLQEIQYFAKFNISFIFFTSRVGRATFEATTFAKSIGEPTPIAINAEALIDL